MTKSTLFPKINALLHGGDYNPEQWLGYPEILEEDIKLMKRANVNVVSLGMFSWSTYQPEEGVYHFEWLDEIIDSLYENGIYVILGTPSGARPAWLDHKYPEAMRVNNMGVRNLHGVRHNHCMSSLIYRKKVAEINTLLAKRYGDHPALILWHISNELGGECYCDLCRAKFQDFLRERYNNDIKQLNDQWWTTFWSHNFSNFEQIDPPTPRGEGSIHGLNIDWKRFTTWNMTDYMKSEIEVFRTLTPDIPITSNFMCLYKGLDYNEMAKELDIISWDSYPKWHTDEESLWDTAASTAFDHSIMRSFKKDKPFMLMESTPSLVNWHPYNKLKRPGIHRLSCVQAIACGSDTVQYFQWRKGRGSFEQYHGAVIDHLGRHDTRVFKEVEEVGKTLKQLQEVNGSLVKSEVAMIFDWDNRWAIDDFAGLSKDKKYPETCREIYKILMKQGLDVDIISSEEDLTSYKVVLAPMLYLLKPKTADNLKTFVKQGGTLIGTYLTGYVNENTLCYLGGFPGDGLMDVFGLYSEEIDTLYPTDVNGVRFVKESPIQGEFIAKDYCEVIKTQKAETLAVYTSDFYKDMPAITVNDYGQGKAYYVAARTESDCMDVVIEKACLDAKVVLEKLPEGIEKHSRFNGDTKYEFYLNYTNNAITIELKEEMAPVLGYNKKVSNIRIEPYDIAICKVERQ